MKRIKKLEPVVQHVDQHEQTALQAVAFSQQQLKMQQDRLQQLIDYKADYQTQLTTKSEALNAVQFQEFNRFMTQLDDTIQQQRQIVEAAKHEVDYKQQTWKEKRARSEAMHKVVDKIKAGEEWEAQQKEQKMMDEFALRLHQKDH